MKKKEFIPTETNRSNGFSAAEHDKIIPLSGMYQEYFLDYASYVILERAVPAIEDGLKPVQRRILHAMNEMHDGRYHKVANIIGQTMQFHPHGDAAIGDALVHMGQKDLLIDPQGNWGDHRTGDNAAAPRYIEARLTKFALDVAFNPDTTVWAMSYDGRKREPVNLPMKFPMVLAHGAEGIAVGLSTKILPHNFIEICKASIKTLKGGKPELFPDFYTGGLVDVRDYNGGARGGKLRCRARIREVDKKTLLIYELPFGTTVDSLIDSILKANDKGKIKIKKVTDATAANVEIIIDLQPGISPDQTIDALYATTDCELNIHPNCCVIVDNKPIFTDVAHLLKISTEKTTELLRQELDIKRHDLEEKIFFSSLEKIFISKRIYRDIEECETFEAVLSTISAGLKKYVSTPADLAPPSDKRLKLLRDITQDDLLRLTEIRIKRISKYNSFEADELMKKLHDELSQTRHHLENLNDFAIAYFENILAKHGKGKERKTEIAVFDQIKATEVVANNAKLFCNREAGFIGMDLKKDEFVSDCSDIDDVIVFRKDGKMKVVRISQKIFVGKDLLHVAVWKKNDERTTYNLIYLDAKTGRAMAKRINVSAITRDKEYDMTQGAPGSKILYFTANPNGESEVVQVTLSAGSTAKIKVFDFDFGELAIKGRDSQGNIVTKFPVKAVKQKEAGKSTIGAQKIWFDEITARLNIQERGRLLGEFDTGDSIVILYNDGSYELTDYALTNRFEMKDIGWIGKKEESVVISAVHFDAAKGWTMVKRFKIEATKLGERFSFISDKPKSKVLFASAKPDPRIKYNIKLNGKNLSGELNLAEFVEVKGWKAMGNKLSDQLLTSVKEAAEEKTIVAPKTVAAAAPPPPMQGDLFGNPTSEIQNPKSEKLKPGDVIEF